jgi:divalent metal cation (Fe/Co/Zn/Cd) transporter
MPQSVPIIEHAQVSSPEPTRMPQAVLWLQGVTMVWMLVECIVSLYAAKTAHSVALLAFGSDSVIELLSAGVALLSFIPSFPITKNRAAHWAGVLLFALAAVIALTAILALARGVRPEASYSGIGITIAALIVMPVLAWFKRKAAHATANRALAADAVQSYTCAYLAGATLAGLAINAVSHIHWVDAAAAVAALPILIIEGRNAMRGESCGCS